MHRPRYYRNPAVYHGRADPNAVRFGYNSVSQNARNTYRRNSVTPFSPSHNRFADRSKYVWTANKQQQSQQQQQPPQSAQQQPQPAQPPPGSTQIPPRPMQIPLRPAQIPPRPVKQASLPQQTVQQQSKHSLVKKNDPNSRDIGPLSVTVLDSPEAVANDIAAKLQEEKVYLISKVVSVLGVKKAIRLYYETRQKEINGGILVQNGIRRRTPGGVFLTLLRETSFISPIEIEKIFQEIKRHELKLKLTSFRDAS